MMSRIRYAFGTLVAPWLVAIQIPLEILTLTFRDHPWRGDGTWTIEWMAMPLFLIGSLLAGAAAVDASRLTRPTRLHLAMRPRAPRGELGWAFAWAALPAAIVHLLAIGTGLLIGGAAPPRGGWGVAGLEIAVQLLALIASPALGSLVGRFLPPVVAGVVGLALAFVANYAFGSVGQFAGRVEIFGAGGSTAPILGWTWNTAFLTIQLTGLVLLIVAAMSAPIAGRSGTAKPGIGAGVAAGIALIALIAPTFVQMDRFRDDPAAPTTCYWSDTVVCVYPEHARDGEQVALAIGELRAAAKKAGFGGIVKNQVAEASLSYEPPITQSAFRFPAADDVNFADSRALKAALVDSLAYPAHCPQLSSEAGPGMRFGQDLSSLEAAWLGAAGVQVAADSVAEAGGKVLTATEAQQIVERFNRCDPAEFE